MASDGDKFIYLLLGGFVGASVALLLAPRSGEETRKILEEKYKKGSDLLSQTIQRGEDPASDQLPDSSSPDQAKDTVSRQRKQVVAAIEAGKEAYEEEKRKLERPSRPEKPVS